MQTFKELLNGILFLCAVSAFFFFILPGILTFMQALSVAIGVIAAVAIIASLFFEHYRKSLYEYMIAIIAICFVVIDTAGKLIKKRSGVNSLNV